MLTTYCSNYCSSLHQPRITTTNPSFQPPASDPSFPINLSSSSFNSGLIAMAGKSNVQLSSPLEMNGQLGPFDEKLATAERYGHEGVAAGARAAVVAAVASAVPTLASVRMIPWARRNINPTAQALIVSLVAGSAFFIVADKTVLTTARKNSFGHPLP